ncbi:hypothetical protein VCO01S_31910 [Vibrio comitans NBRC 102076]|uniref:Transposase n=1 Tax=Vibrio comitans NBRC 102076 TaxID=1219078 RepID=A0A4Y3IT67_9VIBR|nr:hypothetical protein VCO01S_31910 [Vibrio comitans NBRC 102076]
MTKRTRRTFSSEFKLKPVQLVVDQGYSMDEASQSYEWEQVCHGKMGKAAKTREERPYA